MNENKKLIKANECSKIGSTLRRKQETKKEKKQKRNARH